MYIMRHENTLCITENVLANNRHSVIALLLALFENFQKKNVLKRCLKPLKI